ncbi:MAG TPA: MFS transporter [Isosphaeraceae bacterium]|jgi:MFS family permease|nr:MFS transporter [Isosphaeraceae bacterium]
MATLDKPGSPTIRPSRRETMRLGLLFGAIYFIQGFGDPTEGLISQPVRSLLSSWGKGTGEIAAFSALLAVPWSLKPLFGLLTDFVPLWGRRRQSYLILTSALTLVGFLALGLVPIRRGANGWLLAWLFVPTMAVACSDVAADALMVEKGQPRGLTGLLQSIQWACMYAATIVTGVLGGWLSQHGQSRLGFLLCASLALGTLGLSVFAVRERRLEGPREGVRGGIRLLGETLRSPAVLGVGGFLFLWNFNPFSDTVLHLHMTRALGFSEQFYGNTVSLLAVACIVASLGYGAYCRRVPMRWLVHASIVLGIASTLAYWALAGPVSAAVVTVFVGLTYMTATLIQLDLAAQSCPPRVAGTAFALLMALLNLGNLLSTWLGGDWYERLRLLWGSRVAFHILVAIGAAFTAGCWLLVPLLPLDSGGQSALDKPPTVDLGATGN